MYITKRPYLVHFVVIATKEHLSIAASLSLNKDRFPKKMSQINARFPFQDISLLSSYHCHLKIVGIDQSNNTAFQQQFESDTFGNFNIRIPISIKQKPIKALKVYETSIMPGIEIYLGTFLPLHIGARPSIVISDFDKTLVDTKYSSIKEVYHSLTKPLEFFPSVKSSISTFENYIEQGYQPFVLSASPHFYEEAIRDWLYKNRIFSANLFLKDYRQILSFLHGVLGVKDIKRQGHYKLDHLLNILLMTGIPEKLVLMGDNHESDGIIYLTLALLLKEDHDPWQVWNTVKTEESFKLTDLQNAKLLDKIYLLKGMMAEEKEKTGKQNQNIDIKIYIRKKSPEDTLQINVPMLAREKDLVELYE